MRNKQQILSDSLNTKTKAPDWDSTASVHERLIIEVLVDTRDILNERLLEIDRGLHALSPIK